MTFTTVSWNVERFAGGTDARATRIAGHIRKFAPDVIAIYELTSEHGGWNFARQFFPGHVTYITEGQNAQEIMLLIDPTKFDHVAVTQRHTFKLNNPWLRPGALVTLSQGNVHTNMLFLHTASGTLGDAFGDRVEMAGHFFKLHEALQELQQAGGPAARLIICGDLNTMGLEYPRGLVSHRRLTGADEIDGLEELAARAHITGAQGMHLPVPSHVDTFSNANDRDRGRLDLVIASDSVQLSDRGALADGTAFQVAVEGWQQFATQAERNDFIDDFSDHCALVFEVA